MVGMLQIITYLLCVYLVFKGVEIFQIAYMSTSDKRDNGIALGTLMIAAAVIAALVFYVWIDSQAASIANSPRGVAP